MNGDFVLEADHLCKTIGGTSVLQDISFRLSPGSVTGLVGRNGAGKSTLLKVLAGIVTADRGQVLIGGQPLHKSPALKAEVIRVPDSPAACHGYTPMQCAKIFAAMYSQFDMEFFAGCLERFKLPPQRKLRYFSKGMGMLFGAILGLAVRPAYLLLDEPTGGIDPLAKKALLSLLMEEAAEQRIGMLIVSHQLEELEAVADSVMLLKNGVIEEKFAAQEPEVRKLQVVFGGEPPQQWLAQPEIHVLNQTGKVFTLILGGSAERRYDELRAMSPLLLEALPVKLEDMYFWKAGDMSGDE